ncbi:hypothetical protein DPMN_011593 [Dreissena polymorpha]|uniref:Uncharacterized protein n=1 Tax=Dreissena polymorpha TaxID=45954 RepID=A0A9D4N4A8_DREPO|nr:hypothetical protein DPMN_011593 [Dreissena polymorpha]
MARQRPTRIPTPHVRHKGAPGALRPRRGISGGSSGIQETPHFQRRSCVAARSRPRRLKGRSPRGPHDTRRCGPSVTPCEGVTKARCSPSWPGREDS